MFRACSKVSTVSLTVKKKEKDSLCSLCLCVETENFSYLTVINVSVAAGLAFPLPRACDSTLRT